jgi:hypothetical protein
MQRGFSLSWRERRDALVERLITKTMRPYSRKVERFAITNKAWKAPLKDALSTITTTGRYIRRNLN